MAPREVVCYDSMAVDCGENGVLYGVWENEKDILIRDVAREFK